MKTLLIRWQRLVDESGQTCDRCGATGAAVELASEKLERALRELDVEVVLQTERLDPAAFAQAPLESNRVWVGGLPIEWLLSASSGQSRCCAACGDHECRTMVVDGKTYEAIPAELIVRAGLLAAARMMQPDSAVGCCGGQERPSPAAAPPLPPLRCGCG